MLRVLGTKVLVLPEEVHTEHKSGLILTNNNDLIVRASVISKGPACTELEVGTSVLYNRVNGVPVKVEEKTYFLVDSKDVLGYF